jgi:drug/metabolite transporter (DMT)-like permease
MTASDNRIDARDWLLLVVLSVLWGGSFFFNGVVLRELPPFTTVLLRVSIAVAGTVDLSAEFSQGLVGLEAVPCRRACGARMRPMRWRWRKRCYRVCRSLARRLMSTTRRLRTRPTTTKAG